jgi:hypothetical protein
MDDKSEFNKVESDACTLPPDHPLPPDQLGRYSPERDFYAEKDIADYILTQAHDETVQNVERVKTEYVMGAPYEIWDVTTDKDRWWVITNWFGEVALLRTKEQNFRLVLQIALTILGLRLLWSAGRRAGWF